VNKTIIIILFLISSLTCAGTYTTDDIITKGPWIDVRAYGAVGDGATDDTAAIQAAFDAAITGHHPVFFPITANYYKITAPITATIPNNHNLFVFSNGAKIQIDSFTESGATFELLSANSGSAVGVTIGVSGLKFDGQGVAEDWTETVIGDLIRARGMQLEANRIFVDNCTFSEFYGKGIYFRYAEQIYINGVYMDKVGGRWLNDVSDSFGDGIYISNSINTTNGVPVAVIQNCRITGYPADRPRLSRAGVVLEYDVDGVVLVENCSFDGYQRTFHIELCDSGKLESLKINNCNIDRYDIAFLFSDVTAKSVLIDNCTIQNGQADYGGTSGLIASINAADDIDNFTVSNTTFDIAVDCSAGLKVPVNFINCHFIENGGRQTFSNPTKDLNFESCRFTGMCLYFYQPATVRFNNCRLVGSVEDHTKIIQLAKGTDILFENCITDNGYVAIANPESDAFFKNCHFVEDDSVVLGAQFIDFSTVDAGLYVQDCYFYAPTAFTLDAQLKYLGTNYKNVNGTYTYLPSEVAETYTETNVTPDRAFDADTVAVAELADIVGTLIVDLRARGIVK